MKTFLVPSLLALLVVGISQQEAKAGFSIGISIGDHHRHPPVVVARPPVVVVRPPVVHCPPPVVVAPLRRCDYEHGHAYVRACEHHHRAPHWKYDTRRYDSHYHRGPHYHRDAHFRRR